MCAIEAAKRGRKVFVLDHANKPGKKILMSGGGRCNFTNYEVSSDNYISQNPHFCKSALSRYTQWDFLALIEKYQVPFHERSHGQLFCDVSAKDILDVLLSECENVGVNIQLNTQIQSIKKIANANYQITTNRGVIHSESLVMACGGLSIPKMCASPLGYQVAEQFSLNIIATAAGLVPFTLQPEDKAKYSVLSGIAVNSLVVCNQQSFRENLLFTHRGLSGPVILQISSYWNPGDTLAINLIPDLDLANELADLRETHPQQQLSRALTAYLPKRLVNVFFENTILQTPLRALSKKQIDAVVVTLSNWQICPNGTEGYRTAEVTLGGVDCNEISSKTMEALKVPGLYFIGEVLDVTGWLGGYNFQWAWSSGWCSGQYV